MDQSREEILNKVKAATAISRSHSTFYEFDIDLNGYEGHFKVKHPSLMDQMEIGVRRAKLLNGAEIKSLDIMTDNISFVSATLSLVIVEGPSWFDLTVLDDYELLMAVFKEYKDWNESFRRRNEQSTNTGSGKTAKNEGSLEHHEDVQNSNK